MIKSRRFDNPNDTVTNPSHKDIDSVSTNTRKNGHLNLPIASAFWYCINHIIKMRSE